MKVLAAGKISKTRELKVTQKGNVEFRMGGGERNLCAGLIKALSPEGGS